MKQYFGQTKTWFHQWNPATTGIDLKGQPWLGYREIYVDCMVIQKYRTQDLS